MVHLALFQFYEKDHQRHGEFFCEDVEIFVLLRWQAQDFDTTSLKGDFVSFTTKRKNCILDGILILRCNFIPPFFLMSIFFTQVSSLCLYAAI